MFNRKATAHKMRRLHTLRELRQTPGDGTRVVHTAADETEDCQQRRVLQQSQAQKQTATVRADSGDRRGPARAEQNYNGREERRETE